MPMSFALGFGLTSGGLPPFDPASLFANGEAGAYYDARNITSLWQDTEATIQVASAGDTAARIDDLSGNGHHATQAIVADRPEYAVTPNRLLIDRLGDNLTVTAPSTWGDMKMLLVTPEGAAIYRVSIPSGAYDFSPGAYFPGSALQVMAIIEPEFSDQQILSLVSSINPLPNYQSVTDFQDYWRSRSEITSFPLLDTSSGTNFINAWRGCTSLTSFPLLDTSSGTNFSSSWFNCTSLTSFPLLDTSSGTNFSNSWLSCTSLTSFPLLDTSSGTNFINAWRGCTSLTSFPAGMFDSCSATIFADSWADCALDQQSVDNILVSLVAGGQSNGTLGISGGTNSAPSATGLAAKTTLEGRGWTVSVNT